jgi:hypothetical protein
MFFVQLRIAFGYKFNSSTPKKIGRLIRIAVGIGSGVQCLITMDYWVDDADKFTPSGIRLSPRWC